MHTRAFLQISYIHTYLHALMFIMLTVSSDIRKQFILRLLAGESIEDIFVSLNKQDVLVCRQTIWQVHRWYLVDGPLHLGPRVKTNKTTTTNSSTYRAMQETIAKKLE